MNEIDPNDVEWSEPHPQPGNSPHMNAQPISPYYGIQQSAPINPSDVSWDSDTYGTPSQMGLAALEGAARGVFSAPLTNYLETKSGLTTGADIEARQANNPFISGGFETAGLIGSSALDFGVGPLLNAAGHLAPAIGGALKGAELGKAASLATRGGAELGLLSASDEWGHHIADPNLSLGTSAIHVGLSTLLGGAGGYGLGKISPLWEGALKDAVPETPAVSELDAPKLASGDFQTSVDYSPDLSDSEKESVKNGLKDLKPNANEIAQAANVIGAPALEGMLSDNPWIQKAEDALQNGAPTYPAMQRGRQWDQVFNAIDSTVKDILGEGSAYSKAELGQVFQSSLTDQIAKQAEPISALYNELKKTTQAIPLSEKSAPAIARAIENLQEVRISPSSPEGSLARRVINEIGNLKTVDDVKAYKSILNRSISPTASSGEKYMAGVLSDKLTDLENNSITSYAQNVMKTPQASDKIVNLMAQREAANAAYKPFIQNLQTLAEQLGKRRISGASDAINFIRERLTPEEVVNKLFSKNDSGFMKFFSEKYPDEMKLMQDFQKQGIQDAATQNGEFSSQKALKQINKLSPEIQKSLFSAEELQKINAAQIVSDSIPKNFNPSGTSGMNAFRSFFEHPAGAALGNARDFAIKQFIKMATGGPEMRTAQAIARGAPKELLGESKATIDYLRNIYQGNKTLNDATKAFFLGGSILPASLIPNTDSTESLKKSLKAMDNPQVAMGVGGNLGRILPSHQTGVAQLAAIAQNYFNQLKPTQSQNSPLDSPMPKSALKEQIYNRQLGIAQQPLMSLQYAKKGTLQAQDVQTLQTLYPKFHQQLVQKLSQEMIDAKAKGKQIPYQQRQSLSLLMGTPLDSTLTQPFMASVMAANAPNAPVQPQGKTKAPRATSTSMQKLNSIYATPNEARQKDLLTHS